MLQGEEKVLQGLPATVMEELEKENQSNDESSDAPPLGSGQLTEAQEGRAVEDEKEQAREEEEEEEVVSVEEQEDVDEDDFSLISEA
jgi:hypothetical protein